MTDPHPSGDSAAPGAAHPAPAAPAETPIGAFGSTRGSGLARGKRVTSLAATSEAAPRSEYKPTVVAMITPQREYQNPFASAAPANPPAEQPAEAKVPASMPVVETAAPQAALPKTPAPEAAPEKIALNILPAAEPHRPAVSWEIPSASPASDAPAESDRPRRDDRPVFRSESRREPRPEGREPRGEPFRREGSRNDGFRRGEFRGNDPRRDEPRRDEPRRQEPRPDFVPRSKETPKPSGGFLAWLKGLFGAKKTPEETPRSSGGEFQREGESHNHRRRRRGRRGHHSGGENSGPRYQSQGGPGGESQRPEGGHSDGHRRPRHRGGRGRGRGDHRTEGQQGGGAI